MKSRLATYRATGKLIFHMNIGYRVEYIVNLEGILLQLAKCMSNISLVTH